MLLYFGCVYLMFFPENLRRQTAPYAVKTSLSGASSSCDREEFPAPDRDLETEGLSELRELR